MPVIHADSIPIWAVFLLFVATVMAAVTAGCRIGLLRSRKGGGEPEGPAGSVVGAALGLLAFMLAFTFGITAGRLDTRKQLLLDEVNAIGTAALRAQLLPEPHRSECRALLRAYVAGRAAITPATLPQMIREAEGIQSELWAHAVALARADMNSDIGALFAEALNEVFDLHTSRVTVGGKYRIPPMIWGVLIALTVLSMAAVGYQFGVLGRTGVAFHLVLAVSFSLVVTLIADLDRGTSSLLKVSQQPMVDLQARLAGD
jgi:hypothetical protein